MNGRFILDANGNPIPEDDLLVWGKWMGSNDRVIAIDDTPKGRVSTIFLGLDHSFGGALPILYETMVFGGSLDQEQDRYYTKEEALIGHQEILKKVLALCG